MKTLFTLDEVNVAQRSPLMLKVRREVIHVLVAVLDLIEVRRVGALRDPDGTKRTSVTTRKSKQKYLLKQP